MVYLNFINKGLREQPLDLAMLAIRLWNLRSIDQTHPLIFARLIHDLLRGKESLPALL